MRTSSNFSDITHDVMIEHIFVHFDFRHIATNFSLINKEMYKIINEYDGTWNVLMKRTFYEPALKKLKVIVDACKTKKNAFRHLLNLHEFVHVIRTNELSMDLCYLVFPESETIDCDLIEALEMLMVTQHDMELIINDEGFPCGCFDSEELDNKIDLFGYFSFLDKKRMKFAQNIVNSANEGSFHVQNDAFIQEYIIDTSNTHEKCMLKRVVVSNRESGKIMWQSKFYSNDVQLSSSKHLRIRNGDKFTIFGKRGVVADGFVPTDDVYIIERVWIDGKFVPANPENTIKLKKIVFHESFGDGDDNISQEM